MYEARTLEGERPRYEQRLGELLRIVTGLLTPEERQALAGTRLEFPLAGAEGSPLEFYTAGTVGRVTVFMPVFSLLFLEDLATAFAWLHHNGYTFETVEEYVTMLGYKKASDFPGGLYPPPLRALRVPSDAMTQERVKTMGLSLRNEAYAFILLHELGHVRYRHPGYRGITTEQARRNETQADQFALTVLERADTIPMGMVLWFMAQVNLMPSRGRLRAEGKIKSDADWEAYLKREVTHPLTVQRLSAIALHLDGWAKRAGRGNKGDTLEFIASRLARMAEDYDDADLQGCMAAVAHRADPATLAPRRPGAATGGDLMRQHCTKKR
jgi:hypothetical protein